jgi:putative addiction module component (TIGR02574 family)
MLYPAIEIASLTVGERLELIERVWDSLRCDAGVLPLGHAERAIIEARRTEHRENPGAAVPWETVRAELVSDQEADETQARSAKRG